MNRSTDDIQFETDGELGLITLDRPRALNALTLAMVDNLSDTLNDWRSRADVRRVLIKATPGRAFCAGGDIRAAAEKARIEGAKEAVGFLRSEYQMNWRIANFPKPYIAFLNGITMGGGVGISIHGRHRIATENTVFAMPETGIGFFTDIGGSYFLPRLPNNSGFYLGLTGASIGPGDCKALGIATHFVPSAKLGEAEAALRGDVSSVDSCLDAFAEEPPAASLAANLERIGKLFEPTSLGDIFDRLNADKSDFAEQQLALLKTRSPISLHVVFELLKRGQKLDLQSCLQMEFGLVHRFFEDSDFFEGVRAALIDKDRRPHWKHTSIYAVDVATTAWYFTKNVDDPLAFFWT